MLWVAGIDGCRAGWVVVLVDVREQSYHRHHLQLCQRFDDVLCLCPRPTVIAIDIPIGLLSESAPGGRECDHQARKLLKRRASSVFTPPSRRLLPATSYEQVRTQGMSRQTFGIVPKIREVDRLMTPVLQQTIHEAHPELAFMSLTGAPMRHNKKTPAGRAERLQALLQASNPRWPTIRQALTPSFDMFPRSHVAPDDILDAYALTWIAYRIATAQANRLPPQPPVDARGLCMEIWY
jgi:predicted RNase H-like nuclease